MIEFHTEYGRPSVTIGKVTISREGKCIKGWKDFYGTLPTWRWRRRFSNPIFQNKSGFDELLGTYRVWFIFLWHTFQWCKKEKKHGQK